MTEVSKSDTIETLRFEPYFEILRQRWIHEPGFLPTDQADRLLHSALALPFESVPQRYKNAVQRFERFGMLLDKNVPAEFAWLQGLGNLGEEFIRAGQFVDSDFAKFTAKEAAVQRYPKDGRLSGHRDLASCRIAIAIFSFGDDAILDILEDDRETIIASVNLRHGDMVVLGAGGLGNNKRQMHGLRVPDDAPDDYRRVSITFRDDLNLCSGLSDANAGA